MTNPLGLRVAIVLLAVIFAATGCEKPAVTEMGSSVLAGGVEFDVTGYELRYLELSKDGKTIEYSEPVLAISVKATNKGEGAVTYNPSHRSQQMSEASTPLLYLDPGAEAELPPASKQTINGVYLEKGQLDAQVGSSTTLESGESLTDLFLFEIPEDKKAPLILSLPPSMHRGETPVLVRIPYQYEEPEGPPVHQVGESVEIDGAAFAVESTTTEYVKTEDKSQGEGYSSDPLFKVTYKIENTGEETLTYNPSHRDVAGTRGAALYADGKTIKRVKPAATAIPEGQIDDRTEIEPGKSLTDISLFERPAKDSASVIFEYPANHFGGSGLMRVEIDYEHKDPELPKELKKAKKDK